MSRFIAKINVCSCKCVSKKPERALYRKSEGNIFCRNVWNHLRSHTLQHLTLAQRCCCWGITSSKMWRFKSLRFEKKKCTAQKCYWTRSALKVKAVGPSETSGITRPVTQRHILYVNFMLNQSITMCTVHVWFCQTKYSASLETFIRPPASTLEQVPALTVHLLVCVCVYKKYVTVSKTAQHPALQQASCSRTIFHHVRGEGRPDPKGIYNLCFMLKIML